MRGFPATALQADLPPPGGSASGSVSRVAGKPIAGGGEAATHASRAVL